MRNDNQRLTTYEVQSQIYEMLDEISRIFRMNDINYVVSFGTLLGAVRHSGFIPWDDDADIHIWEKDFDRAMKSLDENMSKRYLLLDKTNDFVTWEVEARLRDTKTILNGLPINASGANGIFIDFFKISELSEFNRINYTLLKTLENNLHLKNKRSIRSLSLYLVSALMRPIVMALYLATDLLPIKKKYILSDKWRKGLFEYDDIFPIKDICFGKLILKAPSNIDKILTDMYGDYQKVPDVDERKYHFSDCYLNEC